MGFKEFIAPKGWIFKLKKAFIIGILITFAGFYSAVITGVHAFSGGINKYSLSYIIYKIFGFILLPLTSTFFKPTISHSKPWRLLIPASLLWSFLLVYFALCLFSYIRRKRK